MSARLCRAIAPPHGRATGLIECFCSLLFLNLIILKSFMSVRSLFDSVLNCFIIMMFLFATDDLMNAAAHCKEQKDCACCGCGCPCPVPQSKSSSLMVLASSSNACRSASSCLIVAGFFYYAIIEEAAFSAASSSSYKWCLQCLIPEHENNALSMTPSFRDINLILAYTKHRV